MFCFVDICSKSLVKLTKSRIDVIRRKKKATLKFLKKDIADLLANGLDINAYGRVILFVYFNFRVKELCPSSRPMVELKNVLMLVVCKHK